MAAEETFEWYVSTMLRYPDETLAKIVREHRQYLHTLRSEDERQRYVEAVIAELKETFKATR